MPEQVVRVILKGNAGYGAPLGVLLANTLKEGLEFRHYMLTFLAIQRSLIS